MAKLEWGAKRICHNCGARFYDLRRDPIVCPKCGTTFDPEALLKSRRTRSAVISDITTSKAGRGKAAPGIAAIDSIGAESLEEVEAVADEVTGDDEAGVEKLDAGEAEFEEEEVDETDQSAVLLEDASELGDDDVDEVIELNDDDEESR